MIWSVSKRVIQCGTHLYTVFPGHLFPALSTRRFTLCTCSLPIFTRSYHNVTFSLEYFKKKKKSLLRHNNYIHSSLCKKHKNYNTFDSLLQLSLSTAHKNIWASQKSFGSFFVDEEIRNSKHNLVRL